MASKKQSSSTIKYLIVGDSGVGKTCLLVRYCENQFSYEYLSTIGVDFKIKRIQCDGSNLTLNIWDTAGQERFRNVTKSFYKGAHGIIIAYSITDPDSFSHVERWIDQIREASNSDISMILIATKLDLEADRKVSRQQGQQLAERYNMRFVQTSAKSDENVSEAFMTLTHQVLGTGILNQQKVEKKSLNKGKVQKKKDNDCCN